MNKLGIYASGKKVKHQILPKMARLHLASAITLCLSSYLEHTLRTSSAEDSAENTKEWKNKKRRRQASRDRLQDLPEW